MKRQHFLTIILASFFLMVAFHGGDVLAQTSASGDDVCGSSSSTKCGIADLKKVSRNVFGLVIAIGLPLLVVFVIYRFIMAWWYLQQGNANAYKEAGKKVTQAIIGFVIIIALSGGILLLILKYLGVKDGALKLLQTISYAFIPHAYAAGELLPNPLGATSLYDFIISILNTAMKFFLYPALIGIWVMSGFMYVAAQGAPDKLQKAHKLLLWAFISTLIVFMIQGFMIAIKGTVNKVIPGAISTQNRSSDLAPADGGAGSVCDLGGGVSGIRGTDLVCYSSSRGGGSPSSVVCSTLITQTSCVAAKSSTTGNNCKWSGGGALSAICTD